MSDLTDQQIRDLGDSLTGPDVAQLWILDRHQIGVDARLDALEVEVARRAAAGEPLRAADRRAGPFTP